MEVYVGLADCFDYNDEYYYTTEGDDVLGVWSDYDTALEESRKRFVLDYAFLCESVDSYDLQEFIESLGLPPVDRNIYTIPDALRKKYMERMAEAHVSVRRETVRGFP